MKKFFKALLLVLIVLLLILGIGVYFVYRKVNNYEIYQDKYVDYEKLLDETKDTTFEDCIFYDLENHIFNYKVPIAFLYRVLNKDTLNDFLGLPEEITIEEFGLEPNTDNKTIDIYLGVKYRDYVHSGLLIKTHYELASNKQQVDLYYDDYYLFDEKIMEYVDKYIYLEKGSIICSHHFPTFVDYYQMPDYKAEYIFDVSCDKDFIYAKYDIEKALEAYKAEVYDKNSMQEKLDAVYLVVRQRGIAN